FGPAEMRADRHVLRLALAQELERRQRGTNPRVVGDTPVLERHVEIGADEHPLPGNVRLSNRARSPQSSFPTRSTSRHEDPHSLSYQPKTFASGPFAIVSSLSKMH